MLEVSRNIGFELQWRRRGRRVGGRDRLMKVAVFSAKDLRPRVSRSPRILAPRIAFLRTAFKRGDGESRVRLRCRLRFRKRSVDAAVIEKLSALGVRLIALRCAGYNNVDITAAQRTAHSHARSGVFALRGGGTHARA